MPGTSQDEPWHDGQRASAFFQFWGFILRDASLTMLLRMRSKILVVRSAKRISNHEVRYAAKQRPNWSTLEWI